MGLLNIIKSTVKLPLGIAEDIVNLDTSGKKGKKKLKKLLKDLDI